jgi:hypothetical protein
MPAETIELLRVRMDNMAGSEWTVHVLATRRKDGALTLKVHERSVEYGRRCLYRSGRIRTGEAFLAAWAEALEAGHLDPGKDVERLLLLLTRALPELASLHPPLADRVAAERGVCRAAAVIEARRRIGAARGG